MHMNYFSTSSTTMWPDSLVDILRTASLDSRLASNTHKLRSSHHPAGEIWKHIFSVCVYSDLDNATAWSGNRRFARLEDRGLSGVILYELPVTHDLDGCIRPSFTLEKVFGREENDYKDGMSINKLLDYTSARLVYFPAYTCTSFIIGQVMHAFLTDDRRLRPRPALNGFFVYPELLDCDEAAQETESALEESAVVVQLFDIQDSEDSGSRHSDEQEQVDEKCDSSLDSFGPETPPRMDSPPIQDFAGAKHGDQFATILGARYSDKSI